jgi:hypothetical protein
MKEESKTKKKKEVSLLAKGKRLANGKWKKFCEGIAIEDRPTVALLLENTEQFLKKTGPGKKRGKK